MQKWEYKIISIEPAGWTNKNIREVELNNQFNELGEDGWEFMESQRVEVDGSTTKIFFVFKRPRS